MNIAVEIMPPDVGPQTGDDLVRDRILHTLKIYPHISPSMLQMGIGSSLPPKIWRPILEDLLKNGHVKEDFIVSTTPSGRQQTYAVLSLGLKVEIVKDVTDVK